MSNPKLGAFSKLVKSARVGLSNLSEKTRQFVLDSCDWDELRTCPDEICTKPSDIDESNHRNPLIPQISAKKCGENGETPINSDIKSQNHRNYSDLKGKFDPNNRTEHRRSEQIVGKIRTRTEENRKEKSAARKKNRERREASYFLRLSRRFPIGQTPERIKFDQWEQGQRIIGDSTGKSAEIYLKRCTNQNAVASIRDAIGGEGTVDTLRDRRIVALGLLFAGAAKYFPSFDGYNQVFRGVPETALLRYLRDPNRPEDELPSLSALNGIHRPDVSIGSYNLGYLPALRMAGLFWSEQPTGKQSPWIERQGEWPLNVYHIIGPTAERSTDEPMQLTLADLAAFERPEPALAYKESLEILEPNTLEQSARPLDTS